MEYIKDLEGFKIEEKTAVTLGKFDGIHLGHQMLMKNVLEKKKNGYKAVVFTFDMPPGAFFSGKTHQTLLTNYERKLFLEKIGIDYLIECHFTHDIAEMEPEDFVEKILVDKLNTAYICAGDDCTFGKKARGDCKMLKAMSDEFGFEVEIEPKIKYKDEVISSTLIRKYIEKGEMKIANAMLGYPYTIIGKIVHGNQLGRKLGVPTANILPIKEKKLPPNGVYVSRTWIDDKSYMGITNIGSKPTVSDEVIISVETNIFDFCDDLYGKEVKIELFDYERPERKFESVEELTKVLKKDIEYGKNYHIDKVI